MNSIPRNERLSFLRRQQEQPTTGETTRPIVFHTDFTRDYRDRQRNLQVNLQQCKIALAVADTNRDDKLDQDEYTQFVNLLSGKVGQDTTDFSLFDELPFPRL